MGLIGGSLASLIRSYYPDVRIFGFSRQEETIQYAIAQKFIQGGTIHQDQLPQDLDLVIICTPISLINATLQWVSDASPGSLVLTDVGSIKSGIGINLPDHHTFIPGHPMAGSEKQGIRFADAKLLHQATYILCPQEKTDYIEFVEFIRSLAFRVLELDVNTHDKILASASHFPYLMAGLTAKAGARIEPENQEFFKKIISRGFFDTTRVSSSPVEWGMDVCQYNKPNLLELITSTQSQLSHLKQLLETENWYELQDFLTQIKQFRDGLY